MSSFDQSMYRRQTEWRSGHLASKEHGEYKRRPYPWILPRDLWEEGLWPGIGPESENSLPAYLRETGVQKHTYAHHLNSSWTLCANLYFPFRVSADGRALLASFLKRRVEPEIDALDAIELEYAEPEGSALHPSSLLGETGGARGSGQTSPDLGLLVNGRRGLVLVESKLAEHSFYECSAWRAKDSSRRPGNPEPDRCNHPLEVIEDYDNQCHQTAWGRRYWEHLAPVVDKGALANLLHCPAARHGYQLLRQQALAEGIARSGKYSLVVSAVAVDDRNEALDAALKRSGIAGLRQWGALFKGEARFAVFTHQEWVGWVQEHDAEGQWSDWLRYVRSRYGFGE